MSRAGSAQSARGVVLLFAGRAATAVPVAGHTRTAFICACLRGGAYVQDVRRKSSTPGTLLNAFPFLIPLLRGIRVFDASVSPL